MQKFSKEKCRKAAKKFKALGHPVRLWIAQQLLDEEHCVSDLVEQTEFDFSTISQHLTALKEADVLKDEKRGKMVYYTLKCECVRRFLQCVAEHQQNDCCQQDE